MLNKNITLHPQVVHDFTMCSECKKQIPDMKLSYVEQTKDKNPNMAPRIINSRVICENCKEKLYK